MMEQPVLILIMTGISAVISIGIALYFRKQALKHAEKQVREVEQSTIDLIKDAGQAIIDTVNGSLAEQLDPILKVNSQAMSIIGKAGAAANQAKMMERQVMEAVNQQLPITPDMIEEFSPALAETLRKYPELGPKAMQVIEKMTGGGGDWAFTTPSSRSSHPLAGREE